MVYPNAIPFLDQLDLSAKTYHLEKVAVLYLPFINYTKPLAGIKATAERFKEFFVEPKYTLFYQEDCTINQTHDLIKQIQTQVKEKETPFDGLIVMINGHGDILKGERYFLTLDPIKDPKQPRNCSPFYVKTLFENFSDVQCPGLIGKPKLFFIDTCQGGLPDGGVLGQKKGSPDKEEEDRFVRYPTGADVLLARSSRKEHKSGALQVDSIFLGTLYRAIKQYGAETDLLSLLTRTQNAVSQITGNHGFVKVKDAQGKDTIEERSVVTIEEPAAKKFKVEPGVDYSKQMPNFYSTLTKSVMLPVGK